MKETASVLGLNTGHCCLSQIPDDGDSGHQDERRTPQIRDEPSLGSCLERAVSGAISAPL
jgi:hypothetical protein